MKFVPGLTCHLCGATYPPLALWVCSECLGPLEVTYDYAAVKKVISRQLIESRPRSLWRYLELLPVESPKTGFNSGFTPLVKADRLARASLASPSSISRTTRSTTRRSRIKDRVVSIAATRNVELGFPVFGCASTGNLANSVVGSRGAPRTDVLRLHPERSRAEQDPRVGDLWPADRRRRRQLRRREPAVHADRRSLRMGLCQHQPAQLLRRRRQDDGLRGGRAAWLALPGSCRVAGRGRHAAAAHLQGVSRAPRGRPRRRQAAAHPCRATIRVCAGHPRARVGRRVPGSGQAEHHCEIAGDRQPG